MLLETQCSVRLSEKGCVVSPRDEVTGQLHHVFLANLATLHNVSLVKALVLLGRSLGVAYSTDRSRLLRILSLLLLRYAC